MKKCPSCNRTYTDDALSFCLEDGSPLLSVGDTGGQGNQPPSFDPNATLQYNPARDTNPPPTQVFGGGPPPPSMQPPIQTPSWSPTPPVGGMAGQAKKKSKAIYWILGSVAALVVVGIIAIVGIVVLAGMAASNANNSNNTANKNSNRTINTSNANSSNANNVANKNSGSDSNKTYQMQDDFSETKWWVGTNTYGSAEYTNGEYQLNAGAEGGYVVVYAPKLDAYHTENATTRVTTHSVTGDSPSLGYGLTVYGEFKDNNLEDYAFVIRTDENPAFRVVLHQGGKPEVVLVNWTRSSLIRTGSSPNQLEVRATPDQLSFYINGQFATSVTDRAGYKAGLVGFYTSDTDAVAFDDLEIIK
ncbi:MAG: hypothetical protein JO360_18165 [Acidobacteria bacterium]|nr:hypothetical protein [Acidobacteriota bacterium]